MATMKLNSQDRRDLDKFIRFLALKTVQIIVQSRLGEKIKTKSKPHSSGSDWGKSKDNDVVYVAFNLSVKDMPEVLAETKKALGGQIPTIGLNMCIEISLKTVEGDAMVLETWCLGMTDQCDSMARITYAVYNRMGLLLKSLIAVTRVTPAYKLSCRQGPDSYVICYRVYLGDPQLYALGDGYQQVRVGQVGTPIGTLILSVTYRTKLTITPQKVERECPFMVKSDHFKPDLSPKWLHKPWLTDIKSTVIDELAAACEDCQELGCAPLSSSPPRECNGVHFHQHCRSPIIDKKSPRFEGDIRPCSIPDQQITQQHQGRPMSFSDSKKVGAFAEESKKPDPTSVSEYFVPDVPFSRLLLHDCDNNVIPNGNIIGAPLKKMTNNNINHNNNNNINCVDQIDNSDNHSDKSSSSMVSGTTDDFVLVELKPPFAGSDPNSDLGAFYRECQAAPPLLSFSDHPSLAEQVNDLSNQLAAFEMNLHDFDELVDSLSHNDGWK